jgi:hypothetical protein
MNCRALKEPDIVQHSLLTLAQKLRKYRYGNVLETFVEIQTIVVCNYNR